LPFHPLTSAHHLSQTTNLRFVFLLALVICAASCHQPARGPARELNRRELAQRIEGAVENAGRSQVWIKPSAGRNPEQRETPVDVRAGSEVYSLVLSSLRHEADENHLECALNESRTTKGWRVADVRLSLSGKQVSHWKVLEVRRILHAAIVIDDMGEKLATTHQLLALPYSLTFSVLPHLPASAETAREAHRAGHEVMLHLPMQPEAASLASPGEGEIHVGMSRLEVDRIIDADLASVPQAAGVNNHMGSRATADPRLMAAVMRSLSGHHLFFVDSRTTAASVAFEVARRQGIPAFYRSVFLDDTQSVPYTLARLRQFRRVLEDQGAALAIGHPHPTTIVALAKFLPEILGDDVELEPASHLLQLPEIARLKPPAPRRQ